MRRSRTRSPASSRSSGSGPREHRRPARHRRGRGSRAAAVRGRAGPRLRGDRGEGGGPRRRSDAAASGCGSPTSPGSRSTRSRSRSMITVEPAKRSYDDEARERLVELFGEPGALGDDDGELPLGPGRRAGRRRSPARPSSDPDDRLHVRPRDRRDEVLRRPQRRDRPASRALQRHRLLRGRRRASADGPSCPGTAPSRFELPVEIWREMIDAHYPYRGWVPADKQTIARLGRLKADRRPADLRRGVCRRCSTRPSPARAVNRELEELVDSLLYEGYALYPYTPGATKNATPTPFGIVYPPAYAERQPAHLRSSAASECVARGRRRERELEGASIRFLHAAGTAPQGESSAGSTLAPIGARRARRRRRRRRRVQLRRRSPGERPRAAAGRAARAEGLFRIRACVHNTTGSTRRRRPRWSAPRRCVASCSRPTRARDRSAGSFVSPLEHEGEVGAAVAGCASVNTCPVLASPATTTPCSAPRSCFPTTRGSRPESLGNLFDNTEIEEALVLHVQALSRRRARARSPSRTRPSAR